MGWLFGGEANVRVSELKQRGGGGGHAYSEGQRLRLRSAASPMLSNVSAMAARAPLGQVWVEGMFEGGF